MGKDSAEDKPRSWPGGISAITFFVEDLEGAKRFYRKAFSLPLAFEDDASAAFNFGNTIITPARPASG